MATHPTAEALPPTQLITSQLHTLRTGEHPPVLDCHPRLVHLTAGDANPDRADACLRWVTTFWSTSTTWASGSAAATSVRSALMCRCSRMRSGRWRMGAAL